MSGAGRLSSGLLVFVAGLGPGLRGVRCLDTTLRHVGVQSHTLVPGELVALSYPGGRRLQEVVSLVRDDVK